MKNKLPLAIALLVTTSTTFAEDTPWQERDRLSGNWGGARTALADSGIETFAYYTGIFASNVDGGNESDEAYAGGLFFGAKFDLEKKFGWEDTEFAIAGIDRHGRSIDAAVGGQYSVMQVVGGQTTFLYNVTLEKQFMDDQLSLKFGRMSATDDFCGSPFFSYSMNNAVNGQIRAALFDGVMTSYPFAVWGARAKYQINETTYAQIGTFQLSESMWDPKNHGTDFAIRGSDGLSVFTQLNWNPTLNDRPAHFFVGMNNAFFDMDRFDSNQDREEFVRFYANADYQVYSESPDSDNGLTLFATLGYTSHDDVAIVPVQSTFGANYRGLFPGRENDSTLFFATYGGFSDVYSKVESEAGRSEADYEMVIELAHRFQLSPASYFQPDLQYIVKPGGTGDTDNALVLGFQFGGSF
ncbi:carbohydrate porin [Pelagicoccus enzymogenes]|uniref:carbohydrate porin n=1 Tax=Pelagicoccus enzymogenes TaxID=2773457 RepID=UPI00280F2BD6|nr:carbohydrate porin [Pelagicoccus enzymogenes]MDQ8200397.1 carbohydrate porin [Pelagicoccus enzymogenes]